MKKIGFLSFGHWAPSAQSRTESAAYALLQSIDLAIEAERLGALGLYGASVIWHGLSTADQPSYVETVVARTARNLAIPRKARLETNPWKATPDVLKEAREGFLDRCAVCHGPDGAGQTKRAGIFTQRCQTCAWPKLRSCLTEKSATSSVMACDSPACQAGRDHMTKRATIAGSWSSSSAACVSSPGRSRRSNQPR
jgi:hypothetical protein